MEFILGMLVTLCIVLIAALIYVLKNPRVKEKPLTQEELEEQSKKDEHINKMMNYNSDQAYGGKS